MRTLIDVKKAEVEKFNIQKANSNTDKTVVNGQIGVGLGGVGRSKKHESADKQVAGEAIYVDENETFSSFYNVNCRNI